MVGMRLRNFKRKGEYLWNFSCPLCGDSATNKRAARGYVYKKGDRLNYDCKKCGAGMSVKNFIKQFDPILFKDMQLEYFKPAERVKKYAPVKAKPVPVKADPFKGLVKITDLQSGHFCRKYVEGRSIPQFQWDDLYFTSHFYEWADSVLPGRYKVPKDRRDDEPRLVIPFRNRQGKPVGFQGRQLQGSDTGKKYIFISLSEDEPLIWGLNNIDPNQKIYVLEGPIDAMFVPNAIAAGGGDLVASLAKLKYEHEQFVIVYDNEPRKPTTVGKLKKAIIAGFSVCIWPEIDGSDVNEMVMKKLSYGLPEACQYVFSKIQQGTHGGVSATMALAAWNRIKNEGAKNAGHSGGQKSLR